MPSFLAISSAETQLYPSYFSIVSVIIVFEPKYVIINNLGFDIVYRQEGYNNMYPLRAKDYQTLIYEKGDKNFRIGIRNDSAMAYNFSGIFNLENIMDIKTLFMELLG